MSPRITTLENGFRIVTEAMPGLASAAVGVWIDAGARNEAAEENGIAHFLEHMAFKGTARRSALRIAEEIEDVGGYINAYTSREATAYYARVLGADVPLAIDVVADIVRNQLLEPREIETERGVILQEIGQALDTPDDIIFDWLQETAYPDQPLGRPILGPADCVRRFSREDLARFVATQYGPGQMILAAAGAVDHDHIVTLASAQFGDMPARDPVPVAGARFCAGERRVERELEQAHVALAFEAPDCRSDRLYTAQIMATALGGSMSSRLFQKLREERGLCYTIFAQAGAYADTGMTTIYAGTGGADVAQLTQTIIDEIRRAGDDMSEAEVARARAQLRAGLLMGLESPSSRAERLARLTAIWGRVPDVAEAVAKVDAVTTADVRDAAGTMGGNGRAALALYGPVAGAPDLAALTRRLVA